jgi:hypothetical protein
VIPREHLRGDAEDAVDELTRPAQSPAPSASRSICISKPLGTNRRIEGMCPEALGIPGTQWVTGIRSRPPQ